MSANLCWKPATSSKGTLPDGLKIVLRDSGRVTGNETKFNERNVLYLHGLRDAKVNGAQELIDLIERYDEVVLWLEY